jgi:hypothetical protein
MDGTPAIYKGKMVSKDKFRAFIYAPNGGRKLVESWDAFESHMESGLWFATKKDAKESVTSAQVFGEKPKAKPRTSRAKKVEEVAIEEDVIEEELIGVPPENAAFEVKDDFLPKG